jgi:hypothetical protein
LNDAVVSEITLKLLVFALVGWLLVALISLVFQIWKKEKQSFRIPWWSVAALGAALILSQYDFETMVIGIGMCLYALFVAVDTKFSFFGEYRWWNRHRPLSDADE